MTYVGEIKQIPKTPHWAIITTSSFWIEGDQRSRDYPGHGYPGHSETTIQYQAFTDEEEWKKAVAEHAAPKFGSPKSFVAMKVFPASVETSVNVNVQT
jgi:hypothetical protein